MHKEQKRYNLVQSVIQPCTKVAPQGSCRAPAGRPRFTAKTRQEAEEFFLDALAKWREELGLGRMILVGHSLGGYLAATYALRHPEHVEHLVLVCPAGMVSAVMGKRRLGAAPRGSMLPR